MKVFYFLLLAIFFTSFQNLQAQTEESFITIKKKNETYFVSGIVKNEFIKNQLIETIKNAVQANVNAAELKVNNDVRLPADKWDENLEKQIAKIKSSKTAFIQIKSTPEDNFPEMPAEILNAEIMLTKNDKKIKLSNYKNDIVILSLVADWASPARQTISILNQLYDENLKNVRIIAVSIERKDENDPAFSEFVRTLKVKFQTGWTNEDFIKDLLKISNFQGVPQTFIIKDGRLRGVFLGAGVRVNETLIKTARKTSEEN